MVFIRSSVNTHWMNLLQASITVREWGLEKLNDLPKVTHLMSGRVGTEAVDVAWL